MSQVSDRKACDDEEYRELYHWPLLLGLAVLALELLLAETRLRSLP